MSRPVVNPVYQAFIEDPRCILKPEHRERLKTKRGFTDEFIDLAKFRSCGAHSTPIVTDLLQQFGVEACVKCGVAVIPGAGMPAVANSQLLEEDWDLIPYQNEFGEVFHLRPHRFGFAGVPIKPYFAGTGHEGQHFAVLAESEYKAVASLQMGIPSVGLPGISSCWGEHFDSLTESLVSEGITQLSVCFDNEVKNDPAFPKYYKDKPEKRWETPKYAILMAKRLTDTHLFGQVKVATLPGAWRVEGKADIDGALAAGKTPEEYQAVVNEAIHPNAYFDTLCDEAKRIITPSLAEYDLSKHIRRYGGKYQVYRPDEKSNKEWETVSDFTLSFIARVSDKENTERDVELVSANMGSEAESEIFRLKPKAMASLREFREFLYGSGHGAYDFSGNDHDMRMMIKLEHARSFNNVVYQPDHIGKIDNEDVWLFGNGALIGGVWTPADKYGISWNGAKGFRAAHAVNAHKHRKPGDQPDPYLPTPDFDHAANVDLRDIGKRLFKNYGGAEMQGYEALTAYAWNLAAIFSRDIDARYRFFPVMYLLGQPSSGKTRLGMWLLAMHGIQSSGSNADVGTAVSLERQMSFYSAVPAFFDEMRDHSSRNPAARIKDALLRSNYDRQSISKGLRSLGAETRTVEVRAPILVGGEHRPGDEALNTRCLFAVFKTISPDEIASGRFGSEYEWFSSACTTILPRVLPHVLLHGPAAETMLAAIAENQNYLRGTSTAEPRTIQNYAVVAAAYNLMIDPADELGFNPWLKKHCASVREQRLLDSVSERFLGSLPTMDAEGRIKRDIHFKTDAGQLYLNFSECYNIWFKNQPGFGEGLPNSASVRMQLVQSQCCVSKQSRIGAYNGKCLVFQLSEEICPRVLRGWLGTLPKDDSKPVDAGKKTLF